MKFKLTDDNRFLELIESTDIELEQLRLTLTRRIANWRFNPRVKNGYWDGYYCYLYKNKYVPSGLWKEVVTMCKTYNYPIYLENIKNLFDNKIEYTEFRTWIINFFDGFILNGAPVEIREYQIETAYRILKFRKCTVEMATSAGKTLTTFMVIAYMFEKKLTNRILLIVPNVALVVQAYNDFIEYNYENRIKLKLQMIYSGKENITGSNVVIGTYQSLVKKKKEYFNDFDAVMVDECHKMKSYSIKNILEKCENANYRFGLTGTFPKEGTLERLSLMHYSGPLVNEITAKFLQDNDYISNCNIKIIELDYATDKIKKSFKELYNNRNTRSDVFNLEKKYVIKNEKRINFIGKIVSKSTKSTLVLFFHKEYGKALYNKIRKISDNKTIYYIDGHTDDDNREFYKKKMENNNNVIIIASYGTFSTGINIRNIHNIFFTESFKSDVIIRQSIGRGLRKHKLKENLNVIDIVDDFNWGSWKCYHMRHSETRVSIYNDQKFPHKRYKIKL